MKYDIAFEGGGAKGMVFVGAYREFVQRGHTFGRLLGTSQAPSLPRFLPPHIHVEKAMRDYSDNLPEPAALPKGLEDAHAEHASRIAVHVATRLLGL